MGFFDSIKNALGGKEPKQEGTKGPSMVLKEAGIDPAGLKFGIGGDGTLTLSGEVQDQERSDKIAELLAGVAGVSSVVNNLTIEAAEAEAPPAVEPPPPAPEIKVPEVAPVAAEEASPAVTGASADDTPTAGDSGASTDGKTYTVQAGDSLWKIASEMYGSGAKYMKIFEANQDILDDPDMIKPGQVLKIPGLD